jgi:cell division septal protein FtsQ
MRRTAVLSPRGTAVELPDIASRVRLIAGQRVGFQRFRRKLARRARWIVGGIIVLLLGGATWEGAVLGAAWAARSPRFAVTVVDVAGQTRLTRDEIVTAAEIGPGASILTLDSRVVRSRLLALPLVRHADVIRSFPNRVTLVVEERRPFTVVNAGRRLHWIDEEGVDLGIESRAVALGAPVLSGLSPADLGVRGQRVASDRVGIGLSLLRLLLRARTSLLGQISEIDVSRAEGPVLYTLDGVEVRLGRDDWEARLGRLHGVLAQLGAAGETPISVDLRFRGQVVLRTPTK